MHDDSRPFALPQGAIPATLRSLASWCRWSLQLNHKGKRTKVPDCSTRQRESRRASRLVEGPSDSTQGRGFIFPTVTPAGLTVFAFDLDACRDPLTGALEPWALDLVNRYRDTYIEVTPSGTGLRIWLLVKNPPKGIRNPKVKLPHNRAPNTGDKGVEIQAFGYGVPQFVTVTGLHLPGCGADLATVNDLRPILEQFGMEEDPDADRATAASRSAGARLPVGVGTAPDADEIKGTLTASCLAPWFDVIHGADWHLLDVSTERDPSASAIYFGVAKRVLIAARHHGEAALDYLLDETAWGAGQVDGSADPVRYSRRSWVAKELERVATKVPMPQSAQAVFDDGFRFDERPAGAPEPSTNGHAAPAANGTARAPAVNESPIDRWARFDRRPWFEADPPPRRYLVRHPDGSGFMPAGKAVTLTAEGGCGKTYAVVQLAIAIASRTKWLDHFHIDQDAPQRVLLLLGEEDAAEAHFKLHACTRDLTPEQREAVAANVVILPLAGELVPLLQSTESGNPVSTAHVLALRRILTERAGDHGWALVVIDPQSRFAGVNVESDNSIATRWVQECEQFTRAKGNPSVMVVAHSSKVARRGGEADSRGVTGLTDGYRWHATLQRDADDGSAIPRVLMKLPKTNLTRAMVEPVRLVQNHVGVLRTESVGDAEERERLRQLRENEILADAKADVLTVLRRTDGLNRTEVAALVKRSRDRVFAALAALIRTGEIELRQEGSRQVLRLGGFLS